MDAAERARCTGEADGRALSAILGEVNRARSKFPGWPEDVVHGAAILGEESGELMHAALNLFYGRGDAKRVREEAIQVGAMAVRLLVERLGRET